MANYVEQDPNLRLAGQPWTSAKATADAENLLAVAEGAPGSPIVQSGWHPYNLSEAGGSQDGLIYKNAVDGDVSEFFTPVFDPGYEYRVFFEKLDLDFFGQPDAAIFVDARAISDSNYYRVATLLPGPTSGFLEFKRPFVSNDTCFVTGVIDGEPAGSATFATDRVRFLSHLSSNKIVVGRAFLEKRYTGYPKS